MKETIKDYLKLKHLAHQILRHCYGTVIKCHGTTQRWNSVPEQSR